MEEIFELEKDGCKRSGKIVPLKEAITRSIRPGMKLHVNSGSYANSCLREIIKQYWNGNPGFTLISSGVTTPYEISLVCSGMVNKCITTNYSYTYPTPRPIRLLQEMQKRGLVEIENWSLYSLEQRMMAAAQGVGFMPTKSLMQSSLAEDNSDSFKVVPNPFDAKASMGVVKALSPDISIIHGCVADREGNTILAPPYFTSIWGPRASKEGVVVTVEKIVSSEFIRQHSTFVKLPGHLVKFVCPMPLGAHPQGLGAETIGVGEGYGEDYEFIRTFVNASQDSEGLAEWIKEWVLECNTQDDYVHKLGHEKILFLKGKSSSDAWEYLDVEPDSDGSASFNGSEMMVVAAAREIMETVKRNGHTTMLAGIGSSALAAWLAFYMLKKDDDGVNMLTGLGHIGYSPRPGDPFLMTMSNVMTCTMLTDTAEVYGTFVGGANNQCLSVIGTAQIDKYGNINTVKIGGSNFIGVGGAGDAVNARETLVVGKQSRKRFLEKVPFVGCPGQGVKTLVTDLGVFKKLGDDESFSLKKYFSSSSGPDKSERLQEIQEKCGWEVKVSDALEEVLPPTSEELFMLRSLDPERSFIG